MIKVCATTNVGLVRQKNQDGFFVNGIAVSNQKSSFIYYESDYDDALIFVADGVGSLIDGEYAVEKINGFFKQNMEKVRYDNLTETINRVNEFVIDSAVIEHKQCASTIAGIIIANSIVSFNVGDSKIFAVNNGYLQQISIDDTAAGLLVDNEDSLDIIDGQKLPILQCIGASKSRIDAHIQNNLPKRDYILCTDGFTDLISIDDMEDIIKESTDIRYKVRVLLDKAMQAGGNDNATLIYVHFEQER